MMCRLLPTLREDIGIGCKNELNRKGFAINLVFCHHSPSSSWRSAVALINERCCLDLCLHLIFLHSFLIIKNLPHQNVLCMLKAVKERHQVVVGGGNDDEQLKSASITHATITSNQFFVYQSVSQMRFLKLILFIKYKKYEK